MVFFFIISEYHNHCFMDFDSLWMICLVLLKNNLINNEASNIRIETASAQPAILPQQDGKGLKWVERCQVSHSPVLCWMDKSRKSIGREKEEVGSVRPRSTLWQFCLKTYMLSFIHKLEPSWCKRRMLPYFCVIQQYVLWIRWMKNMPTSVSYNQRALSPYTATYDRIIFCQMKTWKTESSQSK